MTEPVGCCVLLRVLMSWISNPVQQGLGYTFTYDSLIQSVRVECQRLQLQIENVELRVNVARNKEEAVILPGVLEWIEDSKKMEEKTRVFLETLDELPSSCSSCKVLFFRGINAWRAEELRVLVKEWRSEGGFTRVSIELQKPYNKYVPIPSREEYLGKLKGALLGTPDLVLVGVHGEKGAGKTTLVEKLAKEMELGGHYFKDNVVMIKRGGGVKTVSGLLDIQQLIADKLGFDLGRGYRDLELEGRADRLRYELSVRNEKVLIIVDPVEENIDFTKIGIPLSLRNARNRIKIVVTSRSTDLCTEMGAQMSLKVEPLSQRESQEFFQELANRCNFTGSKFEEARNHISSKPTWLPGQLEAYIRALIFQHEPPLDTESELASSRENYLERLKGALLDGKDFVIGVYGPKGAGKTALVVKLAAVIKSCEKFNGVAVLNGQGATEDIQQEIAESLGLNLTLQSLEERAEWLNKNLNQIRKVVFIIEDVESEIDFAKIGIPLPTTINDCRILVVSKSLDVCKLMTSMNLEVEPVQEHEPLDLFDELAKRYNLEDHYNLQEARDHISSKPTWLPGQIEAYIRAFKSKPLLLTGYMALPSREEYLKRLMDALLNREDFVIGVYGENKVGKTMLINKLAQRLKSSGDLDPVVLTRCEGATKFEILTDIQAQISAKLGLNLALHGSLQERTRTLSERLNQTRNVVFIINYMDEKIELNEIGIPWPDNKNNCRIVVVTRSLNVCQMMKTQKALEIEPLTPTEALNLLDELANEYNFASTPTFDFQSARDRISSKPTWLPAQIEAYIYAIDKMIIQLNQSPNWTLMLPAVSLQIDHEKSTEFWKWSPSMEPVLHQVWFLHIEGKAKANWLWPAKNYGAYFVYKFVNMWTAEGFVTSQVEFTIGIGNIENSKSCYLSPPVEAALEPRDVPRRRDDEWLEMEMGIFYNQKYSDTAIRFLVKDHNTNVRKSGLVIRGIELRPLSVE